MERRIDTLLRQPIRRQHVDEVEAVAEARATRDDGPPTRAMIQISASCQQSISFHHDTKLLIQGQVPKPHGSKAEHQALEHFTLVEQAIDGRRLSPASLPFASPKVPRWIRTMEPHPIQRGTGTALGGDDSQRVPSPCSNHQTTSCGFSDVSLRVQRDIGRVGLTCRPSDSG